MWLLYKPSMQTCWGSSNAYIFDRNVEPSYVVIPWKIHHIYSQVGREFAYGPGNRGSIPARVIPKTQKWYLMPPCLTLSIIRHVSRVKWSSRGKGRAPFATRRCCSLWKGAFESLLTTLYIYIYLQALDKIMETPGNFKQIYFNIFFWLQPYWEIRSCAAPFLQFLRKLCSWDYHLALL